MAHGHISWTMKSGSTVRPTSSHIPPGILGAVKLRSLTPADREEVKALCQDWFPIKYPECWYDSVTYETRFSTLAAVYEGRIIGFIIAEVKSPYCLNKEDQDILAVYFRPDCTVAYILSLGVVSEFRRAGIASLLLDSLVRQLTTPESSHCKALFLHVLTSNSSAIRFYESRNFKLQAFLPYYYAIDSQYRDGFSYVLYINGGHPPWGPTDYVKYGLRCLRRMDPCSWPLRITLKLRSVFKSIVPAAFSGLTRGTMALGR